MSDIKAFLFDDDRGVSPVIGVILMVAITVILAAVIAAFVLGLGDTSSPAPQASFDFDYTEADSELEVTVSSGDTFEAGNVDVSSSNFDVSLTASDEFANDASIVSAGDIFTIGDGGSQIGGAVNPGDTVTISFTAEDGGESSTLATFDAPEN